MNITQTVALSDLLHTSARALADVQAGRSLTAALNRVKPTLRSGVQALTYYAMRHWGLACAFRDFAVKKPINDTTNHQLLALSVLLLDASMQIHEPQIQASPQKGSLGMAPSYPAHTLVNQAVRAAGQVSQGGTGHKVGSIQAQAKLINAVLRRFQRERDDFVAAIARQPIEHSFVPAWWYHALKRQHPEHVQMIIQASLIPPTLTLRVNRRRSSLSQVLSALHAAGLHARAVSDQAIVVHDTAAVERLPGYDQGWWSVQDLGAQHAAPLLNVQPGMRVLDACAAPGGKSAHLLECADIHLTALDISTSRLERVSENLTRLGLLNTHVQIMAADVLKKSAWWDGIPYDAILADLPCSGSGVVRHHPDILWLRRPEDIAQLAQQQATMLDCLWSMLKPSGHLLYVTCSIFSEEGEQQIEKFISRTHDVKRLPAPGVMLPKPSLNDALGQPGQDGFFYALLERQTS